MCAKINEPEHVSTKDTLWEDIGLTKEEGAVLELKLALHKEIMKVIEKEKITPKQVSRLLDIQQPQVSLLTTGKVSKMSVDKLTKYLHRLGRSIEVKTTKVRKLQGSEVA